MNRIKQLREKKNLSQKDFVIDLNHFLDTHLDKYKKQRGVKKITFGTASRWENSLNQPTEAMWQTLANFFNVSVEYLQGAYSKEELNKFVLENYLDYLNSRKPTAELLVQPLNGWTIDNYLISVGAVPYNLPKENRLLDKKQVVNLDFWQKNLSDIYDNIAIKWLITKPNLDASKEDVLLAINSAMNAIISYASTPLNITDYNINSHVTYSEIIKNHYMQKRLEFLKKHEYWDNEEIDEGHWEEYPVYDFNHPHPLDSKKYYIEDGKHFYFDEKDKRHYIK